jgi:DNA modification methylase
MIKPFYQDEWATVYCADNRDVLAEMEADSVDLVLTDPPYGIEYRSAVWDKDVPELAIRLPSVFSRVAIIMGPIAIWQFPQPKWVACWARPASNSRSLVGGFNHWSPILLYGECMLPVDFKSWHAIAYSYPPGFGHPSPKPECLMLWLVSQLSKQQDLILDPFLGSGTTCVAAKQLGRKSIGIEISEDYCTIAAKRLQATTPQLEGWAEAAVEQGSLL